LNCSEATERRSKDGEDLPLIPILTLPDPCNSFENKTNIRKERRRKITSEETECRVENEKKTVSVWWLFAYP